MSKLFVPAIHLPHGAELFRTLGHRRSQYKKILKALSERTLLECSPDDHVVLSSEPQAEFLEFLLDLGLGTKNIIVPPSVESNLGQDVLGDPVAMEKISSLRPEEIRFYIHLEEEMEIARAAGLPGAVTNHSLTRMFNTTYFLIRLEEDMDLEAIPREQARSSRLESVLNRMTEGGQKVFARGNESCGGSQVFILNDADDVSAMARKVSRNKSITRYFASKFIEGTESWNFQFFLDGAGGFSFWGASRQLLRDGGVHEGNVGGETPPPAGLRLSEKLAGRLSETGGKGFFGADVLMDGDKAYPAELNMRENTSTPVLAVQRKIGPAYFKTVKISVPRGYTFRGFVENIGAEKLLSAKTKSGLLPFNFASSDMTGYLDVAIFGDSLEEVEAESPTLSF